MHYITLGCNAASVNITFLILQVSYQKYSIFQNEDLVIIKKL